MWPRVAALLRAVEDWLRARAIPKLMLLVRPDNEKVRGFYAAEGYLEEPRIVFSRRLDAETAVLGAAEADGVDPGGRARRPRRAAGGSPSDRADRATRPGAHAAARRRFPRLTRIRRRRGVRPRRSGAAGGRDAPLRLRPTPKAHKHTRRDKKTPQNPRQRNIRERTNLAHGPE